MFWYRPVRHAPDPGAAPWPRSAWPPRRPVSGRCCAKSTKSRHRQPTGGPHGPHPAHAIHHIVARSPSRPLARPRADISGGYGAIWMISAQRLPAGHGQGSPPARRRTTSTPPAKERHMADTIVQRLGPLPRGAICDAASAPQLRDLREERELSQREVGRGPPASIGPWLARAEAGEASLTLDALAGVATVLGAEASVRLYPATGPALRDHIQVRLIETLLAASIRAGSRASRYPSTGRCGASSISCSSSRGAWRGRGRRGAQRDPPGRAPARDGRRRRRTPFLRRAAGRGCPASLAIGRLLLLRSTRATRETLAASPALFRAAYPGRTEDAVAALTEPLPHPGACDRLGRSPGSASRVLLGGPPHGASVGR